MALDQVKANELATTVKNQFNHVFTIVEPEPLPNYPDRYIVRVYASAPTDDASKNYELPRFTLFNDDDLQWFLNMQRILFPAVESPTLERWQIEALVELLYKPKIGNTKVTLVEEDTLYLRPETWGERRWHMIVQTYNSGLAIEQADLSEKYHQRVVLEEGEIIPLLRQLLHWHLQSIAPELKPEVQPDGQADDSGLGEIEDHPF